MSAAINAGPRNVVDLQPAGSTFLRRMAAARALDSNAADFAQNVSVLLNSVKPVNSVKPAQQWT